MGTRCIEKYETPDGTFYGIEDYQDGQPAKEHFFADKATKRYYLWVGGCGFGVADTLEEARGMVRDYMRSRVLTKMKKAEALLAMNSAILEHLKGPPGVYYVDLWTWEAEEKARLAKKVAK